jgi:hypothetical protein
MGAVGGDKADVSRSWDLKEIRIKGKIEGTEFY